jgi:hypothetical protein
MFLREDVTGEWRKIRHVRIFIICIFHKVNLFLGSLNDVGCVKWYVVQFFFSGHQEGIINSVRD